MKHNVQMMSLDIEIYSTVTQEMGKRSAHLLVQHVKRAVNLEGIFPVSVMKCSEVVGPPPQEEGATFQRNKR